MSEPVTPSETLSGEGTKESPYLIESEADLLAVSRGLDKAYRLERDIALSDAWTPVGTYAAAFSGTFDGNGHTIRASWSTAVWRCISQEAPPIKDMAFSGAITGR